MLNLLLLLFSFALSSDGTILMIEKKSYSVHDFYSRYPKKQWERADSLQREKVLNDFITRELCVLEAKKLGFHNDPVTAVKIYNRSLQVLVNESYEYFVARPLLPEEDLIMARNNAKREVFVNHVLVGHSESYLNRPPKRTVDDALVLSQQIKAEYEGGVDFAILAEKYSDDPGVGENLGAVGWVPWGATVPAFQEAAFVLERGGVSSPVLTNFGYHIILVSDVRPSDNRFMDDSAYENLIINITKNSIRDMLRPAAIKYDQNIVEENNVVFNLDAVREILRSYDRFQKDSSLSGGSASFSFLETISTPIIVCVYGNKGYGPKWFAQRLKRTPSSRRPKFESEDAAVAALKTFVLQDIAVKRGFQAGVDSSFSYRWKVNDMVSDLLYDAYLKHLVNIAPRPDSSSVREYYNSNKYEKYLEDEKYTVREIRVSNRSFADSLLTEIGAGVAFSSLAKKHGVVGQVEEGLYGPFSKKQNSKYFDAVSSLEINGISPVIASTNNSFAIIQLVEKIPEKPIDLESVFVQIESLLTKEEQENSKALGLAGLIEKYSVNRSVSLLYKK